MTSAHGRSPKQQEQQRLFLQLGQLKRLQINLDNLVRDKTLSFDQYEKTWLVEAANIVRKQALLSKCKMANLS